MTAALLAVALVTGQPYCGTRATTYSYAPTYGHGNYGHNYNSYYQVPYVETKLTVVATEPYDYGSLLGAGARYDLKAKSDQEFQQKLLDRLEALARVQVHPAPTQPQDTQTFPGPSQYPQQALQQPYYAPQAAPQQATPQQPAFAPQPPAKAPVYGPQQAPQKYPPQPGYNPAPSPPANPTADPDSWGQPSSSQVAGAGGQVFQNILENRCLQCHDSSMRSGGVALFGDDGNLLPLTTKEVGRLYDAVKEGRMPKRNPLPPAELQAFREAVFQTLLQASR